MVTARIRPVTAESSEDKQPGQNDTERDPAVTAPPSLAVPRADGGAHDVPDRRRALSVEAGLQHAA
jgi:hypothetical protein